MKDVNKLKNYRLKYKRYYGIDFDSNYVVHHIDFDRTNNDISNLLLLPKELHQRYHFCLQASAGPLWKSGELLVYTRLDEHQCEYYFKQMLDNLLDVMKECTEWVAYKQTLEYNRAMRGK